MKNKNYGIFNFQFLDNIIEKKRFEMLQILKKKILKISINSLLDVGTTEENYLKSSNYFLKKLNYVKTKKSISNQNIDNKKVNFFLNKSISKKLLAKEIKILESDLVISSATIEHVGNFSNQIKMMKNITKLTKKFFFVTTPYRFYPIDFHTKIPLIHMLPKNIHRKILNLLNLKDYAKEENLNLLDIKDVELLIEKIKTNNFKISFFKIRLFGMISNLIIYGERT